MSQRLRLFSVTLSLLSLTVFLVYGATPSLAQNSGFNLAAHANSHASAADIGLPAYPGATLYKEKPDSDSTVDLGFSFGDSHFRLMAADYQTSDSPDKVLAFYRKALSRYGQVLECDHGKPVGALTVTRNGLTCSDEHGPHIQVNISANSSTAKDLRAGSPNKYRVVGVDDSQPGSTHFGLVYVEVPKESGTARKTTD